MNATSSPQLTRRLDGLLRRYPADPRMREAVAHNAAILRCVRGGLRLAERRMLTFDPRADYWRRPERRFLVAYFAEHWTASCSPPDAVRRFALHAFRHFDRAREDGVVTYIGVDYEDVGGREAICRSLIEHAERLGPCEEWTALRAVWKSLPLDPRADLVRFFESATTGDTWEKAFQTRLPWFPYLGATSLDEVRPRQT